MLLTTSRALAALFAIGLAIGEAAINWGDWQWWPLWVVDYVCVAWLLAGVFATRGGRPSAWLEPIRTDAAVLGGALAALAAPTGPEARP